MTLSDWWFRLRNRVLASPRFQRWPAWFPLTRFIARRRAAALFDLCAGFVYSQVLLACVRLRLFDALAAGPRPLAELAAHLGLRADVAARLLDAAASLQLTERRPGGRYGLGLHGAALVGNPSISAMIEHHAMLYRDLADPVALLRGARGPTEPTEIARFWSYAPDAESGGYSALMAGSLALLVDDILEAYPLGRHRRLLDLGGGVGAFVEAAARAAPDLELTLFDLPAVAARARARLERAGLGERVAVVGGDMLATPLPVGADLITLVRVLHDHDDDQVRRILAAARRALPPGGTLIVAEPMSGTPGAEAMGDAYFGFYLLAMGQGRPRTAAELGAMLAAAGFEDIRSPPTRRPMFVRLLVATAPVKSS